MKKTVMVVIMFLSAATTIVAATSQTSFNYTAPTQNIDGSAITTAQQPLQYKGYCGTSSGIYSLVSALTTSTSMPITAVITSAQPTGKYYCAVTCVDASGNESDFSNEVGACKSASGTFRNCGTPQAPGGLQLK